MQIFSGRYAEIEEIPQAEGSRALQGWQAWTPAAAKEQRGHWTLPYPSKPEKIPFGFWRRSGPDGKRLGHAATHWLSLLFLPTAPPQLDDHTGALGRDEFCAHKTPQHLNAGIH